MHTIIDLKNIVFLGITILFFLVPLSVFAEVVPLAPLPTNFGTDTQSLPGYVNTIFLLSISIGAVLAVIRIIWGGFRYMTSEAIGDVKDARVIITQAIIGLILLLSTWLILFVINPNIVDFKALEFSALQPDVSPSELRDINQQRAAERGSGLGTNQPDPANETRQVLGEDTKDGAKAKQCEAEGGRVIRTPGNPIFFGLFGSTGDYIICAKPKT